MAHGQRRIRIGIDTGGTFTDVVAFDEDTGELVTTKTPSHPGQPGRRLHRRHRQGARPARARAATTSPPSATARPSPPTSCSRARSSGSASSPPRATSSCSRSPARPCPTATATPTSGSSRRASSRPTCPAPSAAGSTSRATRSARSTRSGAVAAARWFRDHGITTIGVCFLHSYANDEPRAARCARCCAASTPTPSCRSAQRGAARVPRVRAVDDHAGRRRGQAERLPLRHQHPRPARRASPAARPIPFYVMKSNGGVLSADEVVHQPITTVLSGPAAGALGAGADRPARPASTGCSPATAAARRPTSRVVLDGEPTLTTEGTVGAYPSKIPMIDVVTVGAGGGSIAWISPEGTLKVGPQSAGADPGPLCYAKGGTEPTITDAHVVLGRIPPHLLGGEIPLDVDAARAGIDGARRPSSGSTPSAAPPASSRSPRGTRPTRCARSSVKRGLDVRDFMLDHLRRLGLAAACRLVDILGLAGVVVPPNPGNVSAFGLLTVDVKNDYVQTARRPARPRSTTPPSQKTFDELTAQAAAGPRRRGLRRASSTSTCAPPTCATSARPSRCGCRAATGAVDEAVADERRRRASTTSTARSTATTSATTRASRSSGSTCGSPASARSPAPSCARSPLPQGAADVRRAGPHRHAARSASTRTTGTSTPTSTGAPTCAPATPSPGPAIVEEFGSTVPVHPGFAVRVDAYRQPRRSPRRRVNDAGAAHGSTSTATG